jgi:hypothetical protein
MAIGGFPSFVEEVKVDFSPTRLNIFMIISVHTEINKKERYTEIIRWYQVKTNNITCGYP